MTDEEIEGGLDSGGYICVAEPTVKMLESENKWLKTHLKAAEVTIYIFETTACSDPFLPWKQGQNRDFLGKN